MRFFVKVLLSSFSFTTALSQDLLPDIPEPQLRNAVYVEALGNGLFGSLNYERQLTRTPGLSFRIGVGFYTEDDFYLSIPVSLHYLIDLGRNNYIDTGLGYTYADSGPDDLFSSSQRSNSGNLHNLFLMAGYRRHFGRDWMLRASFTPLTNNFDVTLPWIGIAIGKRF
jgi:hypothetical protein